MKLSLVISSLGGGGAERVMTVLAKAWADSGNEVTLITLASQQGDRYPLDPAVRRIALDVAGSSSHALRALGNNVVRIRALRRAIKVCGPGAVISFVTRTNVLTLLAATGLRVPVIVSERTFLPGERWVNGIWHMLYGPLYRRAASVVVQTRRCAAAMETVLGRSVGVIPNPLPPAPADDSSSTKPSPICTASVGDGHRTLLAVGRLSPEKGFDLLIEAFAQVSGRHPDWNLKILGEGVLRDALTRMIATHDLAGRISLPGFDRNVRESMRRSDLFVLSSNFEGFPNALLEAMAEGLACVSFDCETGPRELIRHGENGWLVPPQDVPGMVAALDTLMQDDGLRVRLGARAREVRSLYSLPEIIGQWNALLASVATRTDGMKAAQEGA